MPYPHEKPIGHHSLDHKGPFNEIKKKLFFENARNPLSCNMVEIQPLKTIFFYNFFVLHWKFIPMFFS